MTVKEHERKLVVIEARIAEARWLALTALERIKKLEAAREIQRVTLHQERVKA